MSTSVGPAPITTPKVGGAADRRATRSFRSRRVVMSLVGAVLVAAVGVVLAVQVISTLVGRPVYILNQGLITNWAATHGWNHWQTLAMAGGVTLVGVLFLWAGLTPGKRKLVPLHGTDGDLLIGVSSRDLASAASAAAETVTGVARASAHVKGRKVQLTVHGMGGPELAERARAAAQQRIDQMAPVPAHTVTARAKE